MASKRCREQQVAIKVSNMSTSPASDHLNGLHGVLPRRAALRTWVIKTLLRNRTGVGSSRVLLVQILSVNFHFS